MCDVWQISARVHVDRTLIIHAHMCTGGGAGIRPREHVRAPPCKRLLAPSYLATVSPLSSVAPATTQAREEQERVRVKKAQRWASMTSQKSNELAASMEAEAARLEALLQRANSSLLRPSRTMPALLERSHTGATRAVASVDGHHNTEAEGDAGGSVEGSPKVQSPARSIAAIKRLEAEIERGGGAARVGAPREGSVKLPLLRSFAKEEGYC